MLCHLDQPGEDGIGIDRKHAGHGTDAQTLRQRAHRPHELLGRDALAMQRRTARLQKIPLPLAAITLARWGAVRMTIRTEIAPAHPAAIVAVRIGAEMLRGVHLAWPSPAGGDRRRWEGRWQSRWCLRRLLTGRTGGLTGETRK